jgi:hypothetical protein
MILAVTGRIVRNRFTKPLPSGQRTDEPRLSLPFCGDFCATVWDVAVVATDYRGRPWPCVRTNQPLCSYDETTIRRNGTTQCPISPSVDFQIESNGVIDLAQSSSVLLQRLAVNWQASMRTGKDRRWGNLS